MRRNLMSEAERASARRNSELYNEAVNLYRVLYQRVGPESAFAAVAGRFPRHIVLTLQNALAKIGHLSPVTLPRRPASP